VKRSEQPGGGQAELQLAREGREHNVQADHEHRDSEQDDRGIPRSSADCVHCLSAFEAKIERVR